MFDNAFFSHPIVCLHLKKKLIFLFFSRSKPDRVPIVDPSAVKLGLVNIFDCVSDCLMTVETGVINNIKVYRQIDK